MRVCSGCCVIFVSSRGFEQNRFDYRYVPIGRLDLSLIYMEDRFSKVYETNSRTQPRLRGIYININRFKVSTFVFREHNTNEKITFLFY